MHLIVESGEVRVSGRGLKFLLCLLYSAHLHKEVRPTSKVLNSLKKVSSIVRKYIAVSHKYQNHVSGDIEL